MYATCLTCRYTFPSGFATLFAGAQTVYSRGNAETCPRCGQLARTQGGAFDLRPKLRSFIDRGLLQREYIELLTSLNERLSAGEITRSEATLEAEKVSPELGLTAKDWLNLAPQYLTLLLTALSLIYAVWSGQEDAQDIQDVVDKSVAQALEEAGLSPPPESAAADPPPQPVQQVRKKAPSQETTSKNRRARRAEQAMKRQKKSR